MKKRTKTWLALLLIVVVVAAALGFSLFRPAELLPGGAEEYRLLNASFFDSDLGVIARFEDGDYDAAELLAILGNYSARRSLASMLYKRISRSGDCLSITLTGSDRVLPLVKGAVWLSVEEHGAFYSAGGTVYEIRDADGLRAELYALLAIRPSDPEPAGTHATGGELAD